MRKTKRRTGQVNLRQALAAESGRLAELFALWDADGDGSINRKEFSRALKMMGLRVNKDDFNAFCKLCDADNSGTLDLDELQTLLASTVRPGSPLPQKPRSWPMALTLTIYNTLQTTAVQAILYLAVVVIFQTLTDTLRLKEEIHLDLRFGQSFLSNPFDAQLNTFPRIRRIGDVYEWGNQVTSMASPRAYASQTPAVRRSIRRLLHSPLTHHAPLHLSTHHSPTTLVRQILWPGLFGDMRTCMYMCMCICTCRYSGLGSSATRALAAAMSAPLVYCSASQTRYLQTRYLPNPCTRPAGHFVAVPTHSPLTPHPSLLTPHPSPLTLHAWQCSAACPPELSTTMHLPLSPRRGLRASRLPRAAWTHWLSTSTAPYGGTGSRRALRASRGPPSTSSTSVTTRSPLHPPPCLTCRQGLRRHST